jgi:hypothetical protein
MHIYKTLELQQMVYVKCVIQLQNPEFSLIHPFDNYVTNESLLGPEALFSCIVNLSSWFTRARLLDRGIISQLLPNCKRCIWKASFLFATLLVTFFQAPLHRIDFSRPTALDKTVDGFLWAFCFIEYSSVSFWVQAAKSRITYIYTCKGAFPVLARSSSQLAASAYI